MDDLDKQFASMQTISDQAWKYAEASLDDFTRLSEVKQGTPFANGSDEDLAKVACMMVCAEINARQTAIARQELADES